MVFVCAASGGTCLRGPGAGCGHGWSFGRARWARARHGGYEDSGQWVCCTTVQPHLRSERECADGNKLNFIWDWKISKRSMHLNAAP